jgi:FixJ family two-component response regulator
MDGLTEAERHIAALVAQGRKNREVASAMFVARNTIQSHVRHIFQKLGKGRIPNWPRILAGPQAAQPYNREPSMRSEPR